MVKPADFLLELFHVTEVINVYTFFEMLVAELVSDPENAELIVTNQSITAPNGVEVIRGYDFERMIALMNGWFKFVDNTFMVPVDIIYC